MVSPQTYRAPKYLTRAIALVLGLLLIRVIALVLSPYGLHGDEAQYWAWAQDLDWGYFSKPPMVAWLIAATTAIFGDAEWAARLASPLLHSGTAFLIFLAGRKAFSPRTGFWASAVYMLMPAVWVSSMIISTDAALLFFWALGLYAWISLRRALSWRYALLLGVAIGLGIMSKYAMLFFIPPLIIASLFDEPTRKSIWNLKGAMAGLITIAIIAPNIWWNSAHDFATFAHTASNTNLEGKTHFFHPLEFLTFLRDQFGVFGPVPFVLLLIVLSGIIKLIMHRGIKADTANPSVFIYLALFSLTPLLIISGQAFLSRANANWGVSAYPSAALLLAAATIHLEPIQNWRKNWLNRGLLMQGLFCSFLLVVSLIPSLVDSLGATNSVKRLRGWPQTVEVIKTRLIEGHETRAFAAIVIDNRRLFYDMKYYGLEQSAPLYIWQASPLPNSHAELTHPFIQEKAPNDGRPILLINYLDNNQDKLDRRFERLEPLEPIHIHLGGEKIRKLKAWAGYGYRHPAQN